MSGKEQTLEKILARVASSSAVSKTKYSTCRSPKTPASPRLAIIAGPMNDKHYLLCNSRQASYGQKWTRSMAKTFSKTF